MLLVSLLCILDSSLRLCALLGSILLNGVDATGVKHAACQQCHLEDQGKDCQWVKKKPTVVQDMQTTCTDTQGIKFFSKTPPGLR